MNDIHPHSIVGELVARQPNRSRVFQELGIDFCCGGKKSLEEVCTKHGLDLENVVARLEACGPGGGSADPAHAAELPVDQLADYIVDHHHAFLRRELPRLFRMTEKVARVHGGADERLATLHAVFTGFAQELGDHMMKEEKILFPAIRSCASGGTVHGCGIQQPIRVMEFEHDRAGESLRQMRELTDGFVPPDWACNTYRAMLDGLQELEADMHRHVHLENHVLFPRALALAA